MSGCTGRRNWRASVRRLRPGRRRDGRRRSGVAGSGARGNDSDRAAARHDGPPWVGDGLLGGGVLRARRCREREPKAAAPLGRGRRRRRPREISSFSIALRRISPLAIGRPKAIAEKSPLRAFQPRLEAIFRALPRRRHGRPPKLSSAISLPDPKSDDSARAVSSRHRAARRDGACTRHGDHRSPSTNVTAAIGSSVTPGHHRHGARHAPLPVRQAPFSPHHRETSSSRLIPAMALMPFGVPTLPDRGAHPMLAPSRSCRMRLGPAGVALSADAAPNLLSERRRQSGGSRRAKPRRQASISPARALPPQSADGDAILTSR
jgi:hypothetical protein